MPDIEKLRGLVSQAQEQMRSGLNDCDDVFGHIQDADYQMKDVQASLEKIQMDLDGIEAELAVPSLEVDLVTPLMAVEQQLVSLTVAVEDLKRAIQRGQ